MKPIKILKEAESEISQAISYYEEKRRGLGLDFVTELGKSFSWIQNHPKLWPEKFSKFRCYILPRFPFNIWYSLEEKFIRIYAVAHQKRRPFYWLQKKG